MEQKRYELCSRAFRAEASRGLLLSIRPGAAVPGEAETEYILPGEAFGRFSLTWRRGEEEGTFALAPDTEPAGEHFSREPLSVRYETRWQAAGTPVRAAVRWTLSGDALLFELTAENAGDEPLTLLDAGFSFPCNADFRWGGNAGSKVIGHHFISGHGSHLLFERCDGKGPILAVLPQDGTQLEYFDETPAFVVKEGSGNKQKETAFTAYALSAGVRREAEKRGTRLRLPGTERRLAPGESARFVLRYEFAADRAAARRLFADRGLVDVEAAPGLTVPEEQELLLSLRSRWEDLRLEPSDGAEIVSEERCGGRLLLRLRLTRLGEILLCVRFCGDRFLQIPVFSTLPAAQMLEKRAAFLVKCQHRDPEKWYDGLISEWNNETGVLLGPDNYDKIGGWRIYEVSCDDPGLGKPAFLASKLAELPDEDGIRAIDRYVERFVWGGLQQTEEEDYPYAIYGIPDWKQNRESSDPDVKGRLHIWRIYDYPHIALLYYQLYRIARNVPGAPLTRSAETYLTRAARTAEAMFTVPLELDGWSAYKTGLYNELVIEEILEALRREGMDGEFRRLRRHWIRKMRYFVLECTDVFGSEYPFDTTGFESTQILARRAVLEAEEEKRESYFDPPLSLDKAVHFMENQIRCNLACRGELEPAYFWYGSDYRGSNDRYTLSYMSQMGGWAILDYALRFAPDPYALLRLGYGSLLSSWALLNAGREEAGWGCWFPGAAHDGAASGGFEPLPYGFTWLDQPHCSGPWYYSCEIDLGFCGYLRGAAAIVAQDPVFGLVCYGGAMTREAGSLHIVPLDGVGRRFHFVGASGRVHVLLEAGRLLAADWDEQARTLTLTADLSGLLPAAVSLTAETDGFAGWTLEAGGVTQEENGKRASAALPTGGVVRAALRFPGQKDEGGVS